MGSTNTYLPPPPMLPPVQNQQGGYLAQQQQNPFPNSWATSGLPIMRGMYKAYQNGINNQQQQTPVIPFQQQQYTFKNNEIPNPFFANYFH